MVRNFKVMHIGVKIMNSIKMNIRRAEMKDIDAILEIEHNSFDKSICEEKETFLERIKVFNKGFLVVEHNKKVVAYLCSEVWQYNENINEEDFLLGHSIKESHKPYGNEVYISSFAVYPEARKSGIGKHLFHYFLKNINMLTDNPKSVVLLVADNWHNAINIYKNEGFQEIKTIKEFFNYEHVPPHKADGIIMRKLL